jgi:AcrR family transcriptional regulator
MAAAPFAKRHLASVKMPPGCQDVLMAYHHGDLPEALLAAVQEAIADAGISGLSLRDVARRAGVSHNAPAHHFGSKAGLLMALAAEGFRLMAEAIRAELASQDPDDPAVELALVGQAYIRFAISHPAHFEVMFGEEALIPGDRQLSAARRQVYETLMTPIERGRQAGRLTGHPPELVAVGAWAIVHGLAALLINGRIPDRSGGNDPDQLAIAVTNLFAHSVMPRPEETSR